MYRQLLFWFFGVLENSGSGSGLGEFFYWGGGVGRVYGDHVQCRRLAFRVRGKLWVRGGKRVAGNSWVSVFIAGCLGFRVDSLTGCLCFDGGWTHYTLQENVAIALHCSFCALPLLLRLCCVAVFFLFLVFFFAGRITSMGSDCGYRSTYDEKCRAVGVRSKQSKQ